MSHSLPSSGGSSVYLLVDLEQQIHVKFCVQIGRSASETSAPLKMAYGEYAMKKSSVLEWHRWFKEG
jgi:hypothetical protein